LLRGFWVVILGKVALPMPDMTLKMLAILFGIYALVDGTLALVPVSRAPGIGPNWWLASIGACDFAGTRLIAPKAPPEQAVEFPGLGVPVLC
jgi:uncharacterized membrane protein HdeD (DUF308 family)